MSLTYTPRENPKHVLGVVFLLLAAQIRWVVLLPSPVCPQAVNLTTLFSVCAACAMLLTQGKLASRLDCVCANRQCRCMHPGAGASMSTLHSNLSRKYMHITRDGMTGVLTDKQTVATRWLLREVAL